MPLTAAQKQLRDAFGPDAVALIDRQAHAIKELGVDLIALQLKVKAQGEFIADLSASVDTIRQRLEVLISRLPQ